MYFTYSILTNMFRPISGVFGGIFLLQDYNFG